MLHPNGHESQVRPFPLERRRRRRVGFVAPMLMSFKHHCDDARIANLSATGAYVHAERSFRPGAVVDVFFELPRVGQIRTSAVVVGARGTDVALHFPVLTGGAQAALERFVERRAPSAA